MMRPRGQRWAVAALAGALAAGLPLWLWRGFTVDDALITARYAAHIARGLGQRFNADGPITDGVTPLGYAHLLAPFAARGPLAALGAARALGAAAWLLGSSVLGVAIEGASRERARWAALLVLVASVPAAAWAVSGMETGLALGAVAAAVSLPDRRRLAPAGALLAGLVAWLRPEALPFAAVLGMGRSLSVDGRAARAGTFAASLIPFLAAAAIRVAAFGHAYPLAVVAKPSDVAHGMAYAAAAAVLSGGAVVCAAPVLAPSTSRFPLVIAAAAAVHFGAVALAGGDWMPLSRLVAPLVPALALLCAHELSTSGWRRQVAFFALALTLAGQGWAARTAGPAAARVLGWRRALIAAFAPRLAGHHRVAALDVGWVGAATDASVLDLAGVTDPEVAAFSGGHTSKDVSAVWLFARDPDALLLCSSGPRVVEARLLADPAIRARYEPRWVSPELYPVRYTLYERTVPAPSAPVAP